MQIGQNNENLLFLCLFDWARVVILGLTWHFYIYVHMLVFFCHMPCQLWIYFDDCDAWLICMLDNGLHIVTWDYCLCSLKPQIFVWKCPSFAWKFLSLVIKLHLCMKAHIFILKFALLASKIAYLHWRLHLDIKSYIFIWKFTSLH